MLRIIPAYAGNTGDHAIPVACDWDHPRVCGEHGIDSLKNRILTGIIPAYAGNTNTAWCSQRQSAGSSPRMRGTLSLHLHDGHQYGIIPAYAGNTDVSPFVTECHRDHPRVCGEHRAP